MEEGLISNLILGAEGFAFGGRGMERLRVGVTDLGCSDWFAGGERVLGREGKGLLVRSVGAVVAVLSKLVVIKGGGIGETERVMLRGPIGRSLGSI